MKKERGRGGAEDSRETEMGRHDEIFIHVYTG